MNFLAELRRRNVIRMAGLYLVAAWLITQVAGTLLPMFDAPTWIARAVVIALAIGFIPALVFAWVFELTPEGLKRDAEVPASESIAPQTARRMDRAIIVVLLFALGSFAFDRFVLAPRREAAIAAQAKRAGEAVARKAAERIPDKSIAVLPLVNDSGDKDQQYFSDGLSEGLINALSQLPDLKVISRNSSFQFRDSHDDSRAIGSKLGVAHLLEGSVQHAGDAVRITATLVNASDSSTLWSQRYDRPYTDLFKLQDDITRQVAASLETKLLAGAAGNSQSDRPPGGDMAAYNAYLQGIFMARRNTDADMRRAIRYYEDAIRIDPDYALAYASLARSETSLLTVFTVENHAEREAVAGKARAAADKAMALRPDLGRAHYARAFLLQNVDLDPVAAEAEYRRAAELDPQDAGSVFSLGIVYASFGWLDRAAAFGRKAISLDPLSSRNYIYLSRTLRAMRRYDEAEAMLRKAIEVNPTGDQSYCELAMLQILRGNSAAAIDLAQRETGPFWRTYALTLAHAAHGDIAEADAGLKQLIAQYAGSGAFQIAQVYAQRKQPDQMFEWLDRGLEARDPGVPTLRYQVFINDYHDDPRFEELAHKIGLPMATDAKATP